MIASDHAAEYGAPHRMYCMPPLAQLGTPALPVTDEDLQQWQAWTAAVLGALAALDGPLGDAPPEALLAHFDPLVAGAAALLIALRDEAGGQAVNWSATRVRAGGVRAHFTDGRSVQVSGLLRVAPLAAARDAWLTAVVGLAQVTLQTVDRWPDLAPALPATLRFN